VNLYKNEKQTSDDGAWHRERITLLPDSDDPAYQSIELDIETEGDLTVIAGLMEVL
jgi:hypothetical protein